jgi:hypothetical protein
MGRGADGLAVSAACSMSATRFEAWVDNPSLELVMVDSLYTLGDDTRLSRLLGLLK